MTGDLLASASLLAALVGLLYGTWYGEIRAALGTKIPLHDLHLARRSVQLVLWRRAVPLFVTAIALVAVLTPTVCVVVVQSLAGTSGEKSYDPVQACFLIVFLVLIMLSITTGASVVGLRRLSKKLA